MLSMTALAVGLVMFVGLALVRFGTEHAKAPFLEIGRYAISPYNTAALIVNDKIRAPEVGKATTQLNLFGSFQCLLV